MKKICSLLAALLLWCSVIGPQPMQVAAANDEIVGMNVAMGKAVTVSSNHSANAELGWYPNSAVVDGNWFNGDDNAQWKSNQKTQEEGPWVMVDLGRQFRLNTVSFQMADSDFAKRNFVVELSTDAAFTSPIVIHTQGDEPLEDVKVCNLGEVAGGIVKCQFIRIRSTAVCPGDGSTYFGVAEVRAYAHDLEYTPAVNVALGKPVEVSGLNEPNWYSASAAVDGYWFTGSVGDANQWKTNQVSEENKQPWMVVDLGATYLVSAVVFQMAESTYAQTNFEIALSLDRDFTTPTVVHSHGDDPALGIKEIPLSQPVACRYIRVRSKNDLPEGNMFGVAELMAFAQDLYRDAGSVNVAREKKTVPSSLHSTGWYQAAAAVDGIWRSGPDTDINQWKSDQTGADLTPSLVVDLGAQYALDALMFQMENNDSYSHTNFVVEMGTKEDYSDMTPVYTQGESAILGEQVLACEFESPKTARYIRIRPTVELVNPGACFGVAELKAYTKLQSAGSTNIAQEKPATPSSLHTTGWYQGAAATDGTWFDGKNDASQWKSDQTGADKNPFLVVDLGATYRIDALALEMANHPQAKSHFVVEFGLDESFANVQTVHTQGEQPFGGINLLSFDQPQLCRYIRIRATSDFTGADAYFGVAEVMAFTMDLPYTPTDGIETLDESGQAISAIPQEGTFKVRYGGNGGETGKNLRLYQVGYNQQGQIVSIELADTQIPAHVAGLPVVHTVNPQAQVQTYRFFLWENAASIQPETNSKTISR